MLVALALSVSAAILWAPVTVYALDAGSDLGSTALLVLVVGSILAVKGRAGGRVATTVAVVLLDVLLIPYCWIGFLDSENAYGSAYAVQDMLAVLTSTVALVLLYRPPSSEYFCRTAGRLTRSDLHS